MIEKKQVLIITNEETDEQTIKRLFPKKYNDLREGFSKAILNILILYRSYNYRIELEAKNTLRFNSLR
jgi:hypothetical protein